MEKDNFVSGDDREGFPFEVGVFDFPRKLIAARAQKGIRTLPLELTCFDVGEHLFLFGSNIGIIYGFRRRDPTNKALFLKAHISSTSISLLKLLANDLVAFASDYGIFVWDSNTQRYLYGWRCDNEAKITCLQHYFNPDQKKLLIFTGDSSGGIRRHDVILRQQSLLFTEEGHEIVQIECISEDELLVSSCSRTFALKLDAVTKIGRNERKQCGKYGAVWIEKYSVIYAARPSLHLAKANSSTGDVVETYTLKKASQPQSVPSLAKFKTTESKQTQLGFLLSFSADSYLVSWNANSILIVQHDGQLIMKESNLRTIIDVHAVNSEAVELFILFETREIVRIRLKHENSLEEDEVNLIGSGVSSAAGATESVSTFLGPFSIVALAIVEDEVKRAFTKVASNVNSQFDRLTRSLSKTNFTSHVSNGQASSSEFNPPNDVPIERLPIPDDNPKLTEECQTPLVVHKKHKKKVKQSANVILDISHADEEAVHVVGQRIAREFDDSESTVSSSSASSLKSASGLFMAATIEEKVSPDGKVDVEVNSHTTLERLNSDDILSNILQAYKDSKKDEGREETILENEEETVDEVDREVEAPLETLQQVNESATNCDNYDAQKVLKLDWEMVICTSGENSQNLATICASGVKQDTGIIWFSARLKNEIFITYYPGLNKLKSPVQKQAITSIASSMDKFYILFEGGLIFVRNGIDATTPIGNKWGRVELKRPKNKIISMSLSGEILWCCDEKGSAWVYKIASREWVLVTDIGNYPPVELARICVAPLNSAMVWSLSKQGEVYCRQGIFNDVEDTSENALEMPDQDTNSLICGISWVGVNFPLDDGDHVVNLTVTEETVWALTGIARKLYCRLGINAPLNYIGDLWQEVKCPILVNDRIMEISGSATNSVWLLTEAGTVWRSTSGKGDTKSGNQEDTTDLDWLII